MKSFGAEGLEAEVVRSMILRCLHAPEDAHELVEELCMVSRLQEQKVAAVQGGESAEQATLRLMEVIDVLRFNWRTRLSEVELNQLLSLGLREAELGRSKDWRTLLLSSILPVYWT